VPSDSFSRPSIIIKAKEESSARYIGQQVWIVKFSNCGTFLVNDRTGAGVWLGGSSERDGFKLVTELGVCAFFGFLAYLVVLGIGRFVAEGRPFLAKALHSFGSPVRGGVGSD